MHLKDFNFNKIVPNLDTAAFSKNNAILLCNCKGSQFVKMDHISKDILNIVKNNKLRKCFNKEP